MYLHSRSAVNDSSLKFQLVSIVRGQKEEESVKRKSRMMHGQAPYFFFFSTVTIQGINLLGVRTKKNMNNSSRICVGVQLSSRPIAPSIIIPTNSNFTSVVRSISDTFLKERSYSPALLAGKIYKWEKIKLKSIALYLKTKTELSYCVQKLNCILLLYNYFFWISTE